MSGQPMTQSRSRTRVLGALLVFVGLMLFVFGLAKIVTELQEDITSIPLVGLVATGSAAICCFVGSIVLMSREAPTVRQVLVRDSIVFVVCFGLAGVLTWLPPYSTRWGVALLRAKLTVLSMVLPGPIGSLLWEVFYGRPAVAFELTVVLVVNLIALAAGIRLRHSRFFRLIGYLGVVVWVFMGLAWAVGGY